MTIAYSSSIEHLVPSDLSGFLAHWDFEPPAGTLLEILNHSTAVILARDVESSVLCGYITALSDGVACAYISALEVRSEYRRKGIGTALLNQMVDRLDVFSVYLSCAPPLWCRFMRRLGSNQESQWASESGATVLLNGVPRRDPRIRLRASLASSACTCARLSAGKREPISLL